VLALLLAGGFSAAAQSNNGVPGPTDYARFSQFITTRNIFNPNRYAINPDRPRPFTPQQQRSAPSFTLVGTMSYEKGLFAFFDGNQSNLRKVLYQSESNSIAGFTLAEITLAGVKLQAPDKKQTVELEIGQGMQQQGGTWQVARSGGFFSGGNGGFGGRTRGFDSGSSSESAAPAADSSSPDAGAAPSPSLEGNDILKKLMQQRQQELK
jgi:hypothetical protein